MSTTKSTTIPTVATAVKSDGSLSALADASVDLASDAMRGSFDALATFLDSSVSAVNTALDGVESMVVSTDGVSAAEADVLADVKGKAKVVDM